MLRDCRRTFFPAKVKDKMAAFQMEGTSLRRRNDPYSARVLPYSYRVSPCLVVTAPREAYYYPVKEVKLMTQMLHTATLMMDGYHRDLNLEAFALLDSLATLIEVVLRDRGSNEVAESVKYRYMRTSRVTQLLYEYLHLCVKELF